MRVSDDHSVVDIEIGKRLNPGNNIFIEDQVWVGVRVLILKWVRIGKGSVIGTGSVVTKDIPENCMAAGNPAKILRENTTWVPEHLHVEEVQERENFEARGTFEL